MIGNIGSILNSARGQFGTGVPDWALWILLLLLVGTISVLVWVTLDYFRKSHAPEGHHKDHHPDHHRKKSTKGG